MSALTSPVLINQNRAYWLSSIQNDVTHSTITAQEIDTNLARFSTVYVSDFLTTSTLNASSFTLTNLDLSNAEISTLKTNNAYTSSLTWASDLSGGSGSVLITTDPSGVKVSGDPIVFGNLVYFTSTINLVPVSTIVDTDIFSSNAYFSTMSSGTISAGQIQANTASLSTLFVSSITAIDISGFSPSLWSQFPTLNSSITFNGSNILSNVGNKLYFAGNEITDLSGGGANWSAFPATQDVSMNNFSLRQVSTLQYQDGAKLYSLTGNNLLYNGQPVQYGTASNVSQWANYPAVNTIQTAGNGINSSGNLNLTATSNVRILADQISTVADNGIDITTTSKIDLTAQNGYKGQINMTANPGYAGLYGEINMTANGGTVAGIGTGGLVSITANTPLGTLSNATSAIKLSASGINSYAGAVPSIGSLAGYNFIYGTGGVNIASGLPSAFPNVPLTTYIYGTAGVTTSSDFYVPNIYPYWNGLTTPPDLFITGRYIVPNLAQVYVQLSNVKNIFMDTPNGTITNLRNLNFSNVGGQISNLSTINGININSFVNQSNILASNVTATVSVNTAVANTQSTIANAIYANQANISTSLNNFILCVSSVFNNIAVNNIKIADDITGVTNAPMPLQSRLLNFSTVNSFNVSTTDLWVSSINGLPVDISGGGGGGGIINNFSTLTTSSFQVSSMGWVGGIPITLESFLRFSNPNGIDNVDIINLNSEQPPSLTINASTIVIGGNNTLMNSVSTQRTSANSIKTSTITGATGNLDVASDLTINGNTTIPQNNVITFTSGGSLGTNNLISQTVPCITNGGPFGSNLGAIGANQFLIGSGTGAFGCAKLYCDFPGDNWGVDIIDANGNTLFETLNCYDTAGFNFQTNVYGVSSIVGYTANTPGAQQAVGVQGILTAPVVSTQSLLVSSINGQPVDGGSFDDQFSTIFVSSLNFSTATSVGSNANFNYPLTIDYDQAGSTNAGVAIAVQGHSYGTGAVVNRIEMGARGSGENYIMSVWPGHNLEELFIDATDVTIRDGVFSTIINLDPFGLQTTGGIKGPFMSTLDLNVSSINNLDANKAYTNNIQLSSMELYAGSTTLMYWDSVSTDLNINTSGNDVVVGLNGTFKIGASFQFISPGVADEVEFFFLKNDVISSNDGGICVVKNNESIIQYFETVQTLANGDKIQVGCYTANSNVYLSTIQGTAIQSPAVILTAYKVD